MPYKIIGGVFFLLIDIKNLTFSYDGSYENIFENVTFRIDTNWKLGFTGRNGRGKTTFLNLLLGKFDYKGNISSPVSFEYFPYMIENYSLTAEQIASNIVPNYEFWRLETEISRLNLSEDILKRPFSTLSNGEQTKALLAILFIKENSFLLIDEPTNHLDAEGRKTVAAYLNSKRGFILVSHDRKFLDDCIDHILSINKANIEIQSGNFSSWYQNKESSDNFERKKNEQLKQEIIRLKETAREKAVWSDKVEKSKIGSHQADRGRIGHLSAKMMKRSKDIEKRNEDKIAEKSKLLKNIEIVDSLKISQDEYFAKRFISLHNLTFGYNEKTIINNISIDIQNGDRIALCGQNGSGKSTILKILCGEITNFSGEVYRASGIKISYVSQDDSLLSGNLYDYAKFWGIDNVVFFATLRKLDFSREMFDKDIKFYSAGQKKKVSIARSLCEKASLYLWDEPLNYIDVFTRIQIEELLLGSSPTIVFVEHDRAFCDNIATKIVLL